MNNTQAATIIVGICIPFAITICKQITLPRWANLLITGIVCAAAGTLTAWATGSFTGAGILTAIAIVFVSAQAVYAAYWKDAPTEAKLNAVTSITSSSPSP